MKACLPPSTSPTVAQRFSAAAPRYESYARLQAEAGQLLLAGTVPSGLVMDLGCGTGRETRRLLQYAHVAQVLAVDLAAGMLQALPVSPRIWPLQADAQALPLPGGGVDMVFSNFALQWCADLSALCRELARVLKPGGELHFTVPLPGSLQALAQAGVHINAFAPQESWRQQIEAAGLRIDGMQTLSLVEHYPDARALLGAIKAIGANSRDQSAATGLRGRAWWQALSQALEAQREPAGLPLRYEVLLCRARRPA